MTNTSIYRDIEFIGSQEVHATLHEWYENLPENEVKTSITKVKCREFRPYDPTNFRVIVLCKHPFAEKTCEIERANKSGSETTIEHALNNLISSFTSWVDGNSMPEQFPIGQRCAFIDWWPAEMLPYVLNELSPQGQAQLEMNHHILDCLELIRLATISNQEFSGLWENSNDPFLAAGRLAYGEFQWIREVPESLFSLESERQAVLERVGEFSREYLGLIRLASIAGLQSPLVKRVSFVVRRFQIQHAPEIPAWQEWARDLLDNPGDIPIDTPIARPARYGEIDGVCDRLRHDLAEATQGLEDEIPGLINSFLPTLRAPQSAELFTGNIHN
jgi:hypothetical protein